MKTILINGETLIKKSCNNCEYYKKQGSILHCILLKTITCASSSSKAKLDGALSNYWKPKRLGPKSSDSKDLKAKPIKTKAKSKVLYDILDGSASQILEKLNGLAQHFTITIESHILNTKAGEYYTFIKKERL